MKSEWYWHGGFSAFGSITVKLCSNLLSSISNLSIILCPTNVVSLRHRVASSALQVYQHRPARLAWQVQLLST